jgi:hypothetical protein
MFSNGKTADGSESSWAANPGTAVPVASNAGIREQASRLVKTMNTSSNRAQLIFPHAPEVV